MCGIAGVFISPERSLPIGSRVESMADTLKHRGPDRGDTWIDTTAGIGLAHRRLSIVDLSEHGNQPIHSHDGRFVMVFNGEIYNHMELRENLSREGFSVAWKGHSDSETLIECISTWGLKKTLVSLVGMFSFALWDKKHHTLSLARDRIGEKPLYYGVSKGVFAFSSELRALREVPEFELSIDGSSVASFLRLGYVPDPHSIYEGVYKVPPGTWVVVAGADVTNARWEPPQVYWSLHDAAQSGQDDPLVFDDPTLAVDELERLLSSSVKGQLMGDVPVGAFLSGGIDSSTIASIMQKNSSHPIKTFSIGFEDKAYDEMPYAAAIAKILGTDHHELTVNSSDAIALIPQIPTIYDEPFADSSQIPTYFLARLAKAQVQVSLSGDGGDELFAGYNRYFVAGKRWKKLSAIPVGIRRAASHAMTTISPSRWNQILAPAIKALPKRLSVALPGDKIHKIAGVLSRENSLDLFRGLVSQIDPPLIHHGDRTAPLLGLEEWPIRADLIHQMMAVDTMTYLPGDILVKVDRATMAHSLESRMPFLDHRVVEFAWKLPLDLKLREGQSKWVLRQVLNRYVPEHLFDRPKMGFGIPLGEWLRGPLKEWASDLLSPAKIRRSGYLDPHYVATLWDEHLSGERNWQYGLWNILMLQAWLEQEQKPSSGCE